jgi:hypothetical protein
MPKRETDCIMPEIRDEAKLWIQADVEDLALLVGPLAHASKLVADVKRCLKLYSFLYQYTRT